LTQFRLHARHPTKPPQIAYAQEDAHATREARRVRLTLYILNKFENDFKHGRKAIFGHFSLVTLRNGWYKRRMAIKYNKHCVSLIGFSKSRDTNGACHGAKIPRFVLDAGRK